MSLYSFLLLGLACMGAAFSAIVYVYGKSRVPSVFLSVYNAVFALWCFGQFMGEISVSAKSVLFWTRFNLAFAVLIPVVFLMFVHAFLGSIGRSKGLFLFFGALSTAFWAMIPTRYFIDGIISTKYFKYYPKGGPIYIIFLLFFLVLIVLGFVKLIKAFNVSSGTRRNQILYVILASVVGFGGGVLWFLPAFGFDIYPFGIFIVPIYLFIAAYAILRHNLLDINIVLRRRVGHSLLLMMGLAEAKKDPVRFESLAGAGILAAAIAHEIKNPLTAIKGMVQSLPGNLADREFMENFNDIVPRQIEKINTSVERLLRSIKGSSAKRDKANVEEFSSEEIIDDILFLIRMQCEKHGIVIEKTAYDPARIRADKDLIAQAFFNIIMNAVQAMPCGGDLRVNISRNTVEISDTGQGIKKEHIGRIFEPFFSEKEGGTGIGLPIAAGIIEGAGGKISVESTEGKGSRFKIEF